MINLFNTTDRAEIATAFNPTQTESRAEMVEAIADLKAERTRELEPLNHDYGQSVIAFDTAKQALEIAEQNKRAAEQSLNKTRHTFNHQISRVEARLLACVPDSVNDFIELLRDKERAILSETPPAPTPGVNQKAKERSEARNLRIQDTNARLELLRGSIVKAEGLRLNSAEGITTGLQELRTALNLSPVTQ